MAFQCHFEVYRYEFLVINPGRFLHTTWGVAVSLLCFLPSSYQNMSKDNTHSRAKNKPSIQKVNINFFFSYTNIRGLHSNYPAVELHFQEIKPDLRFIHIIYMVSDHTHSLHIHLVRRKFYSASSQNCYFMK